MRLHETFIRTAKRYEKKLAIIDRATNQRVTYRAVLLRALILAEKLKSCDDGFVGIMVPTSAGCIYAMLAVLISGRTPVMINYSTGAAENCRDAQRRLAFRTVLTSRALLDRIKCPVLDGMISGGLVTLEKVRVLHYRGTIVPPGPSPASPDRR